MQYQTQQPQELGGIFSFAASTNDPKCTFARSPWTMRKNNKIIAAKDRRTFSRTFLVIHHVSNHVSLATSSRMAFFFSEFGCAKMTFPFRSHKFEKCSTVIFGANISNMCESLSMLWEELTIVIAKMAILTIANRFNGSSGNRAIAIAIAKEGDC
jgi:hypothetical protein